MRTLRRARPTSITPNRLTPQLTRMASTAPVRRRRPSARLRTVRRRESRMAATTARSQRSRSRWRPTRRPSRCGRRCRRRRRQTARRARRSSIRPHAGRRSSSTRRPLPPDRPGTVVALTFPREHVGAPVHLFERARSRSRRPWGSDVVIPFACARRQQPRVRDVRAARRRARRGRR